MATSPVRDTKGSSSFTVPLDANLETYKPMRTVIKRISGFPWRVSVARIINRELLERFQLRTYAVELFFKASDEYELWSCDATINILHQNSPRPVRSPSFASWKPEGNTLLWHITVPLSEPSTIMNVEMTTECDGESFTRRPSLEERSSVADATLVVEGQKIPVNKQFLAAHSSFFNNKFEGDWKDKDEIHIGEVEYEEFANMLKMLNRSEEVSLTDQNALSALKLAAKFEFKIVADRVLNFILSSASSLPILQKLRLTEKHNLPIMPRWLASQSFSNRTFKEIRASPELMELSIETVRELFKKKESTVTLDDDDEDSPPVKKSKDDEPVSLDAGSNQTDGILVFGDKKIPVNKELLISYSPVFEALFNGEWKEKNMSEIPIGEVTSEEFSNFIRIAYGMDGISLTEENVGTMLQLADRFLCEIVAERIASTPIPSFSTHHKLFISDKLLFVKPFLLAKYKNNQQLLNELSQMPQLKELSIETVRSLFEMKADLLFDA